MAGGRPTKYDPKYCQMLIDHMASGMSYETFGSTIGVSRRVVYDWEEKHEEFLHAKKEAFDACQAFWEKIGLGQATGKLKGASSATWIFNMKNRFNWTDKTENTLKGDEDNEITINLKEWK